MVKTTLIIAAYKSVLLIIRSNFRRQKKMILLSGLFIVLAALLFSSGLIILKDIQQPFDKLYNKLNASHIVMLYDASTNNTGEISNWFRNQPEVERVSKGSPYYLCNGPLLHKGRKIDVMIQLTEYTQDNTVQDQLQIINGKIEKNPQHGEIWLPHFLAGNYDIKIGDTIGITSSSGLYQVVLSATVADPQYGSGMVNPTRGWIAEGELPFFISIVQLRQMMTGIRLKDPNSTSQLWERFMKQFEYSGVNLTYLIYKNAYMSIYMVMGNIILAFSIMALLISLFIVYTAISRAVYNDYRLTGVYKSLGFTPKNIISVYVLQYLILAIISIPAGLTVSWTITGILFHSIAEKLGGSQEVTGMEAGAYFFAFVIILLLILITSFFASLKASRIKPAEAIRFASPFKRYSRLMLPRNIDSNILSLSVIMGIRFLTSDIKESLSKMMIIVITFFIIFFSINISDSFEQLKYNKPAWGFENGDIQVSRRETGILGLNNGQLMEILLHEQSIDHVVPFSYASLSILSNGGLPIQEIFGKVYADSLSRAGLQNIYGTHPLLAGDISLCIGTARQFNKHVGDSIDVFIEGERTRLKVTGIYQDVSNMGQGFRFHENTMKKLNPIYTPSVYSIKLKEGTNVSDYKNHLLKLLGETINIDAGIEDRIAQMGIITSMKAALASLSLFFIIIMMLSINADLLISIQQSQKHFGILKSTGWTPREMRMIMVWKIILMTGVSLLFAIPLSIWISPLLMGQLTGGIGLIKFPFVIDYTGIAISIPVSILVITGFAWWLSKDAAGTNTRTLIDS